MDKMITIVEPWGDDSLVLAEKAFKDNPNTFHRQQLEFYSQASERGEPSHDGTVKAYNPDQPRDEHGRWAEGGGGATPKGDYVAYHGTVAQNTKSIMDKGIVVRSDQRTFDRGHYKGERGQSVYIATTKGNAEAWAKNLAGIKDQTPVVFKVTIPSSAGFGLRPDEHGGSSEWRYVGAIKPEWIRGYTTYDSKGTHEYSILKAAASTTFYVGILVDGQAPERGEPSHDGATKVAKFDPDQPRDEHGRWSPEGGEGSPNAIMSPRERVIAQTNDRLLEVLPSDDKQFIPAITSAPPSLAAAGREWGNKLSNIEATEVIDYTGMGYAAINSVARDNPIPGMSAETIDEVKGRIATLDKALSSAVLPGNTTVYRSFSSASGIVQELAADPKIEGMIVHDAGFASTSVDFYAAAQFGRSEGLRVVAEIKLPENFNAAYVASVSGTPQEKEVLIPRNVAFKVDGVRSTRYDTSSGNRPVIVISMSPVAK